MNYIDAHVHLWTDDTLHYPLEATPIRPGDGNELLLRDTRGPKR
jgi:hypothetical protein